MMDEQTKRRLSRALLDGLALSDAIVAAKDELSEAKGKKLTQHRHYKIRKAINEIDRVVRVILEGLADEYLTDNRKGAHHKAGPSSRPEGVQLQPDSGRTLQGPGT